MNAVEPGRMTKGERTDLLSLVRKRERVMTAAAHERAASMLADFEKQSASIYSFDDDAVWAEAMARAQQAASETGKIIADRCHELGIPQEFAPMLSLHWHGRGQNAVAQRRDELRRAAKAKIAAIEAEAITKIGNMSLEAQTDLLAKGLETDTARAFLSEVRSVDALMPTVNVAEVKALIDARYPRRTAA